MKFSLITVCLNSESTVEDTLKSVACQDYSDVEHIVFDGGSTDGTLSILESYADKIQLVRGKDSGIFDAMNQAIAFADGDIVGILNSDDFYPHKQVLSTVAKELELTGADSVYGDLHYVYRDEPTRIYRNWKSGHFEINKFKYGWTIPHPTFFVKREVYERYGSFDTSFKISGDYELILRLLYLNQISVTYIPDVLVKMRAGGNSDGDFSKRLRSLIEDSKAWKVNQLNPYFFTIPLKPLRKFRQFFIKTS